MRQNHPKNDSIHTYSSAYEQKKEKLLALIKLNSNQSLGLHKKTASNLFRYVKKNNKSAHSIAIKDFDNLIAIDTQHQTLEVEGLTCYEKIVNVTLQHQLLPTVAPELKHITIGGAIVGIGIESTGYKYGFVHDGLLEAEVLLHDGRIVVCTSDNEYSDLFHALPNSYGTLGYILRAKIKLYPAKPFVQLTSQHFSNSQNFINAMKKAIDDSTNDFIEGLSFSPNKHYLMLSRFTDNVKKEDDIYHKNIFYHLVQTQKTISLTTEDYIFRYDPDWFWNIPETPFYNFLRKFVPKKWRNSGIYKKYIDWKHKLLNQFGLYSASNQKEETLIQDWEVSWDKGFDLLQFALTNINLNGKPWAIVPIKPLDTATLYPLKSNELYFNLGCYCASKKSTDITDPFYNTKLMDSYCFGLDGLKMLYSSTFLTPEEFNRIYNGNAFQILKKKYDPRNRAGDLYKKTGCMTN